MRRIAVLLLATLASAAEAPKIHVANFSADRARLYVQFETPTAL